MTENVPPDAERQPLDENIYKATRQWYDSAELEVSGRYDKWILTLSGGALGLSITFLDRIAGRSIPCALPCLVVSWTLLVLSLLLALASLVTSQSAIREARENLDTENAGEVITGPPVPRWFSQVTNLLNWGALFAFIFGVGLLCVFSFSNLPFASEKGHDAMAKNKPVPSPPQSIQEGYVPPSPPRGSNVTKGFVPPPRPKSPPPRPKK